MKHVCEKGPEKSPNCSFYTKPKPWHFVTHVNGSTSVSTVRVLHRLLEWRHEGQRWPVTSYSTRDLLNVLVKRINEASAPYQMFGELADVILLRE